MAGDQPSRQGACPVASADVDAAVDELMTLQPDRLRCPYPVYDQLRREAPVYWSPRLGCFVVTRYAEIDEVVADPVRFSSAYPSGPSSVSGLATSLLEDPSTPPKLLRQARRRIELNVPALLNADPPLHVRQRKLVSQGFTPRRVRLMEPEVRTIAAGLLDAVAGDGRMDFVAQFALPLPMTVIANVLGVPLTRMADFKRWSNALTRGVGALGLSDAEVADLFGAVDEFYDYFTEQIADRRAQPRDDLLTDLVNARLGGEEPLTLNELLQMLATFLVGGNETTTNLLSSMTLRLLSDADLMRRVRDDMSLIPSVAEEILRLESPVQGMFRTTTCDTEIAGTTVPAGSMIWVVYGSGNRDAAAMAAAEEIKLDSDGRKPHLAFGRGEHFCLGAAIARLETRVGMELVLQRFPDLALASDSLPPVHPSFVLHGPRELEVVF
jgi:cytochrome P450